MISATKMVGLAAVVALVGGVLAVSGTLDVQQDPVPAATIEERLELTGVQGTLEGLGDQENGMCEFRGGLADCRGDVSVERYDWDDDRLDGYMVVRTNKYSLSNAPIASTTHSFYLENEGGSWAGSGYGYTAPADNTGHMRATLEGAGDYEGLTAILNFDMVMDMSTLVRSWAGTGVIVGPGLPDMPEPATQGLLHQYHE